MDVGGRLTSPMRVALERLGKSMAWIDGRSRKALVRRGLAYEFGHFDDALLGKFVGVAITEKGRAHLKDQAG